MIPWWEGPLLGFDLETTGVDVEQDRIVTAQFDERAWIVDPGIPIPEGASAIHGVTTERAKAEGLPPVVAMLELWTLMLEAVDTQTPVVAFNGSYDFTLLDRECRRHIGMPLPAGLLVVDPFVLDKKFDPYRRGKRKLVDVAERYKVTLAAEDAHDAAADARAAVAVARAIGGSSGFRMTGDPYVLHALQIQWRWEQQDSLEEHFRKSDPTAVVAREWPIQPLPKPDTTAGAEA